jgi:hypothetical protein
MEGCGDLPTPPYGHRSLEKVLHLGKPQDRTFRSEEGILTIDNLLLGFVVGF